MGSLAGAQCSHEWHTGWLGGDGWRSKMYSDFDGRLLFVGQIGFSLDSSFRGSKLGFRVATSFRGAKWDLVSSGDFFSRGKVVLWW